MRRHAWLAAALIVAASVSFSSAGQLDATMLEDPLIAGRHLEKADSTCLVTITRPTVSVR